jgi:hypothetical protein
MTNSNKSGDYQVLLQTILKFHSILGTIWPRPGVAEMQHASIFIGTNLFKTLENGVSQIDGQLKSISEVTVQNEIEPFWSVFKKLFKIIATTDRGIKDAQVDFAVNLLYLGSGVLYHRIAEFSSKLPSVDARMTGVEGLPDLLQLCHWPTNENSPGPIIPSLIGEMMSCSRDLQS